MATVKGGRSKRVLLYVYLWLIHVDIWQKPTKFCKAIILQLKTKKILKTTSITLQAYQNVVPKRERKDLR